MGYVMAIKAEGHFFESDPANGIFDNHSLDTLYQEVEQDCQLHPGVPEEVRSYFNVVVTLYLYGWLYFPFYAVASERSFFGLEMALKKRFPPRNRKGRDRRSLQELLREANVLRPIVGLQTSEPFLERLTRDFREARNRFAHPKTDTNQTPECAFEDLRIAAEIINALWPKP